jgi:hypothetical protein
MYSIEGRSLDGMDTERVTLIQLQWLWHTPEGYGSRRDRTLLDIKVDLRLMKIPVLDWA